MKTCVVIVWSSSIPVIWQDTKMKLISSLLWTIVFSLWFHLLNTFQGTLFLGYGNFLQLHNFILSIYPFLKYFSIAGLHLKAFILQLVVWFSECMLCSYMLCKYEDLSLEAQHTCENPCIHAFSWNTMAQEGRHRRIQGIRQPAQNQI